MRYAVKETSFHFPDNYQIRIFEMKKRKKKWWNKSWVALSRKILAQKLLSTSRSASPIRAGRWEIVSQRHEITIISSMLSNLSSFRLLNLFSAPRQKCTGRKETNESNDNNGDSEKKKKKGEVKRRDNEIRGTTLFSWRGEGGIEVNCATKG